MINDVYYPLHVESKTDVRVSRARFIEVLRKALKFRAESGKESPHFYALLDGLSDEVQYQIIHEMPVDISQHVLGSEMSLDRELLGFQSAPIPQLGGYEVTVKLTASVTIRKR